jgi:SlyX protein
MATDNHQLHDLQMRLTFIDEAVGALSDADAGISKRLLAIEQSLREIRNELGSLRDAAGHDPHSEPPPPHY